MEVIPTGLDIHVFIPLYIFFSILNNFCKSRSLHFLESTSLSNIIINIDIQIQSSIP